MTINYKVSTITYEELYPVCLKAVQRFIKGSNPKRLVRYFGSYYTLEDLAMEAVEKVLRAKPEYLTRSYANMAAKCACIDRLTQPKLPWQDVPAFQMDPEGSLVPLEHTIEGDNYNHMEDLELYIRDQLPEVLLDTYEALLTGENYGPICEIRDISTRTFERRVRLLKETIEDLLEP